MYPKIECYECVSFDQVILRGYGIDVHKDIFIAVVSGEGFKTEICSRKTFSSSLTELKEWLLSNDISPYGDGKHRCLLKTGVQGDGISQHEVRIVNARHIKYVSGHKTD